MINTEIFYYSIQYPVFAIVEINQSSRFPMYYIIFLLQNRTNGTGKVKIAKVQPQLVCVRKGRKTANGHG